MRHESSSDVAADEAEDERSVTAVAEDPGVTRERAPEVAPGDVLAGRYQIEALIGKGGSGVVLRAFDRVSAMVVAVKVLKTSLTHDPRWEKRFQRELRLGRPVQHPNVCRIFDIGDADGYRFLTMEHAKGGTLRDLIKKNQPLRPLADRLTDANFVIAGLAAIHAAGIVHRDVKPDNMLRMDDGRLVLSDFGLATDLPDSTMVSVFVGTPHYMAPEVREGDPATTRSDVWSLGVVLYEIFFGKRPERRASRTASGLAKSSTVSTSSTIERAMMALCLRCLADDPAERPEDARAVQKLFDSARRAPYMFLRAGRRRWISAVTIAAAAVAMSFGIGVHRYHGRSGSSVQQDAGISRVTPTGSPADWSKTARTVTSLTGHVHCFSVLNDDTARIVWGTPRRASDVNLRSGDTRPAPLAPETYAVGCPERWGPDGRILYVANSSSGATEVRLSSSSDGQDGSVLASGSDPIWLKGGDEFVYSIDPSHAAIFSLPMKSFRLLAEPGLPGQRLVLLEKASSLTSGAVALLFGTNNADRVLAIYEGRALDHRANFIIPAGYHVQFDPLNDNVLVSRQASATQSTLCSLDWRTGLFRSIGRYPGFDLVNGLFAGREAIVLARRRTKDAWLMNGAMPKKLTTDGENYSAALGANGDLLLSKRSEDGTLAIWKQRAGGETTRLTAGPLDVGPDVSPDGSAWVYTDYAKKSVMLCTQSGSCKVLRRDELLPAAARFSRDGKKIAYVTQTSVGRLVVVSVVDGSSRQLGDANFICPPVWSSADSVWTVDGGAGQYFRSEWDATTGRRTGRRISVAPNPALPDDVPCTPADAGPESPFFEKVDLKAEETSALLSVPWSRD